MIGEGSKQEQIDNLEGVINDAAHHLARLSGNNPDKFDYSDLLEAIDKIKEKG